MVKSYERKDIRPARPKTIQHADKGNFKKPEPKSKKDIVEEKSLVTKQNIKEKKKAMTPSEKKDLDANKKKETKTIHSSKGIDVEIKKKPKKKSIISKIKDYLDADKDKPGFQFTKPKKAKAAEVGKGGKSPGPKERHKLLKTNAQKDREAIAKQKKKDAKAKATREEARKPKKKEAKKQAETGTRDTTFEARVKALMAKKAELSKKETADGRNEYQVRMNKLKKENKKAWKKAIKSGKSKG